MSAAEAAHGTPDPPRSGRRVVSPHLVGRDRDLELLASAVTHQPGVAVVEGMAGIGKTRLLAELTGRPAVAGCRWLAGGCRKVREPAPLGPVIHALRGLGTDLQLRLSPVAGALRPLLPELSSWLPLAPDRLDDRAAERDRVFRGLTELLGALGALGPVVLVLDDLQWADDATLEFLSQLLAEMPARLGLVLAYRSEEVAPRVRAVTANLRHTVHHTHIELSPLDAQQVGALAAAILGTERVASDFAAHLCERGSGVPLAVEELLALLRARGTLTLHDGRWDRRSFDELAVPAGIRDPVLERFGGLSATARRLAEVAAVLGEPATIDLLVTVSTIRRGDAVDGIDEALASGLLTGQDDLVGWRHVLAAQAVYDALSGPRRTELHHRAATALQRLDPAPLGQLAHHLRYASRWDEWAVMAERAADQAVELRHEEQAARLLEDVLRHAPSLTSKHRGRIALKLARAAHETTHVLQTLPGLLTEVLEYGVPHGARGELMFWLAMAVERSGGEHSEKRQLFAAAVDNLDDRPDLQAWAMMGLGIPMAPDIPVAEHQVWLQRALDTIPRIADPQMRVYLLGSVASSLAGIGDPGWRTLTGRITATTGGAPRRRSEVNAYYSVGLAACYAGHHRLAGQLLNAARDGAAQCQSRSLELSVRSAQALLNFCRGAWDGLDAEAQVLLDELVGDPGSSSDVEMVAGGLALAHGQSDKARQQLVSLAQTGDRWGDCDLLPFVVTAQARLAVAGHEDLDAAVTYADRMLETLESKQLWLPLTRALPAVTELMLTSGRAEAARELLERCAQELTDADAPLTPPAIQHGQGLLDAARNQWTAAITHYLAAANLYDHLDCPYEAAQTQERAASAMFEAADARAEPTLRAALAAYRQLGATWDAARCTQLGRSHGIRLPVGHRGGRTDRGQQLSPRELDVARLVATGLTDRQIAAQLYLAPATVNNHLSRAMRRVGVHTRTALAAWLAEQDQP